jgi:cytochrome c-type biogenesis protein CcmH
MSSNVWIFAIVAVVIVGVFSASLYRAGRRGPGGDAPRWQPLALMLAVPLIVAVLYLRLGTPKATDPQAIVRSPAAGMPGGGPPPDPKAMVASLEKRLRDNPGDLDGWLMLARSYQVLERYPEAAAAYERAQSRVMDNSGLLVNWIELRLMSNNRKFDARTLELLDQAAKLAPDDPDVLLLRALAAFDRGDQSAHDALVARLYELLPPGSTERQNVDAVLNIWTARAASGAQSMPASGASAGAPSASNPVSVPDINTMVQRLADRLKEHPEDTKGWLMLGRSYAMLGRYADSDAAFQHAEVQAMQDRGMLMIWIEARLRMGGMKFDSRARDLLARANALAPNDTDVMIFNTLAAWDSGDKAAGDALAARLRERIPANSPERTGLDAALEQLRPPGARGGP